MEAFNELEKLIFQLSAKKQFTNRIKKELSFIKQSASANLFLEAYNLVNNLKEKHIIIGPANGYTNSSLINFLIGITTINPFDYNLIFEPYFNLSYFNFDINVSQKNKVPKKFLATPHFKIRELPILKMYKNESRKIDYTFNLRKLNDTLNFISKDFYFERWQVESAAMEINNEKDLINSLAISHFGTKGFHMSKLLHNEQVLFKELKETNGLLLFQEQWILLVEKYSNININEVCKLRPLVGKRRITKKKFRNYFPNETNKETIDYLFDILYFLPAKSHTVAEAKVLNLELNKQ